MFKVLTDGCEPTKGSKYSACIDLYASEDVIIGAGETKIVGLGVAIDLEKLDMNEVYPYWNDMTSSMKKHSVSLFKKHYYLQLNPRSSLRAKGLLSHTGIIDLDFIPNCKIGKALNNRSCKGFKKKAKE